MRCFAWLVLGVWMLAGTGCAFRGGSASPLPAPRLSPGTTIHEVTPSRAGTGPRVLCVVAHPDDEVAFAATLYKTAVHLDGVCDLVVVTNGEGGYKYSTLAEPFYGIELTDEAVGRERLPAIRRKEQIAGLRILEVRRLYALNQTDHRYTVDEKEVLGADARVWNVDAVRADLLAILRHERYDFVLTHLPVPGTHAHHKGATILTLEAIRALDPEDRPVVLGSGRISRGEFSGLEGYPITEVLSGAPPYVFDRTQRFGHDGKLSYQIIVNWVIAEHKSQGTLQLLMNGREDERFWLYAVNREDAPDRARSFFGRLAEPYFKTNHSGTSAGAR